MSTRTSTPRGPRARPRRPKRAAARTAQPVRSAAERAVERVLTSQEAFGLLIRRLEDAGWHVERDTSSAAAATDAATLTPPARAR